MKKVHGLKWETLKGDARGAMKKVHGLKRETLKGDARGGAMKKSMF